MVEISNLVHTWRFLSRRAEKVEKVLSVLNINFHNFPPTSYLFINWETIIFYFTRTSIGHFRALKTFFFVNTNTINLKTSNQIFLPLLLKIFTLIWNVNLFFSLIFFSDFFGLCTFVYVLPTLKRLFLLSSALVLSKGTIAFNFS